MSEFVDAEEIAEFSIYGYIGGSCYIVYAAIIFGFFLLNSIKMWNDFFGDRKSLHTTKKPEITPAYTAVAIQTQLAIFFFLTADIIQGTTYGLAQTVNTCDSLQTAAGICYQFATCIMYTLLLTRLYWNYARSKSPVSLNKIIAYVALIVMYNFMIILVMATYWRSNYVFEYEGLNKYPNYCDATLEPVTATLITIQEIVVTITFLYVFYDQLRRCAAGSESDDVLFSGRQLFVLSAVSMISTSGLVIFTIATGLSFIIGADPVINVICLVLLEVYYPWKCYSIICCPCRFCIGQCLFCPLLQPKGGDKPKMNVNSDLMLAMYVSEAQEVEMPQEVEDVSTK